MCCVCTKKCPLSSRVNFDKTASCGKRKRGETTGVEGKRVVFVVGGKRGEPIEM